MSLADKIKGHIPTPRARRTKPLWGGPQEEGVTFSLLSRFLVCRERFRLLVIEGLKADEGFNHRLEFGNLWHLCEQQLAAAVPGFSFDPYDGESDNDHAERVVDFFGPAINHATSLANKHRMQQEQVWHWFNVCRYQFPIYTEWWRTHRDTTDRTPILQERAFNVDYRLPSGRDIKLRGKWDSVDLVGKGLPAVIDLWENKTKGDINERQIKRQLRFDLQTMIYLVALRQDTGIKELEQVKENHRVGGVLYNVIRRPLSGGKGNIKPHKAKKTKKGTTPAESMDCFYTRLCGIMGDSVEPNGDHYFFKRWRVEVTEGDVTKFRQECLDPILEQLCDWWDWITSIRGRDNPFDCTGDKSGDRGPSLHWRHPFGVRNVLDEGGSSDLDEYLENKSEVGLERTDDLFPELASS